MDGPLSKNMSPVLPQFIVALRNNDVVAFVESSSKVAVDLAFCRTLECGCRLIDHVTNF